jgi:type II secretory ATPase GspE/PulE/Tfp pilus assembly ATPase PilB-like protein/tetratricopeptide (TPR) repeat protein
MDISSEKQNKINIDARMHAADTFYSMGLFTEAMDAYNEIIQDIPDLDENKKVLIKEKIKSIQKELGEMDHKEVTDLTAKELNLIRKTFTSKGHDGISQLINSGYAFRELGLYEEAINEYQKLFSLEYPKIKIFIEILECLLKIKTHAEGIKNIQEMMDTYGIKGNEKGQINSMLGFEMEKRGYNKVAQDLLKLADHKNHEGRLLQERHTALSGTSDEKSDTKATKEKNNHLLVEKIQKTESFSAPVTGSKYDYLIKEKLVNLEQLQTALALSKKQKKSVEHILIEKFNIQKEQVGKSLSGYSNCQFKSFDPGFPVPYELIGNLKQSFLLNELWIPLKWDKNSVEILVDDPKNLIKTDRIRALVKAKKLIFSIGTKEDIEAYIHHFFENKKREDSAASMGFSDTFDIPDIEFEEEDKTSAQENLVDESSSQIVRLVDQVIITAYRDNISDIHVEPSPVTKKTLVRFRRDGVCQEYVSVPNSMARAILSRIKIMSNLDIAERRLPQDGKIKFRRKGVPEFELRVATIPTTGGFEDVVLRILAKAGAMPLEEMGMTDRNLSILKKIISQPYGLILVVGPTGSGKTTTLHAALGHINKPSIKIWTAEDPVEITQAGLRQVEVKPKIGLDFARVMRAFLRADPDVIMIGEMRDFETASTGIEASLTGHLVFSTLHTNSAPETITRLLDMGLNPLNFSDAFRGVLAQRLVRKLCKDCREQYQPSEEDFNELVEQFGKDSISKSILKYSPDLSLYKAKGCEKCNESGYRGRMGIHEMMEGTNDIKKMIKKQSTTDELFKKAAEEGMLTLKQDGILKVVQGVTDLNEVRRVCID